MTSEREISKKPFIQLLLILSLCVGSVILFSIMGVVLTIAFFEFDLTTLYDYSDPNTIAGLKLMQLLSAIGLFVVPPIIYGFIVSKKPREALGMNVIGKPINYIIVLALMVISTPALSWIIELNAGMVFPDFLAGLEEWMRESEAQAEELTKVFLSFDGLGSLFYILLIVAVVPAVGEELLFRGVLQKILIQWTKRPHLAIWITAIAFSALHLQFFGFFPRMLLGVVFGYVFYWSKSLWLPILGHFINNGSVVLLSYFSPELMEDTDLSIFEQNENSTIYYVISLVLSLGLILLIKKVNIQKNTKNQALQEEL